MTVLLLDDAMILISSKGKSWLISAKCFLVPLSVLYGKQCDSVLQQKWFSKLPKNSRTWRLEKDQNIFLYYFFSRQLIFGVDYDNFLCIFCLLVFFCFSFHWLRWWLHPLYWSQTFWCLCRLTSSFTHVSRTWSYRLSHWKKYISLNFRFIKNILDTNSSIQSSKI